MLQKIVDGSKQIVRLLIGKAALRRLRHRSGRLWRRLLRGLDRLGVLCSGRGQNGRGGRRRADASALGDIALPRFWLRRFGLRLRPLRGLLRLGIETGCILAQLLLEQGVELLGKLSLLPVGEGVLYDRRPILVKQVPVYLVFLFPLFHMEPHSNDRMITLSASGPRRA